MTTVQMPQLGETIIEGTILSWLKSEGDTVTRDEPLFEISTDKVDTEVPSPVAGTVSKILVAAGETVPVGTALMEIAEEGEAAEGAGGSGSASAQTPDGRQAPGASESPSPAAASTEPGASESPSSGTAPAQQAPAQTQVPAPATAAAAAAASGGGAVAEMRERGPRSKILSPLVRRLASEHGIDLDTVEGTGAGGRITKHDVMAAIERGPAPAPAAGPPAAVGAAPAGVAPQAVPTPAAPSGAAEEVVPMSHIRRAIATHMVASLQTTARAWTMVEVNVEPLVRLRADAKESFVQKYGAKLTYLPFVVRATCDALLEYPMVNAELRGEDVVVRRFVNMGIAVSYDEGLIVPVIRRAETMNVPGLAQSIADLAVRAREHRLQPDEVQGATFTITNPGPYGSVASVPIINQPNAGILSLDAIQQRPVVVDDAIAIRHMVFVSMSWDHRVIDGELATRFLARVKHNLETWDFSSEVGR
jgi:2-oxoglutarate dehydrogenase E2 component (dihydrolipoamide succinyltransferase)